MDQVLDFFQPHGVGGGPFAAAFGNAFEEIPQIDDRMARGVKRGLAIGQIGDGGKQIRSVFLVDRAALFAALPAVRAYDGNSPKWLLFHRGHSNIP